MSTTGKHPIGLVGLGMTGRPAARRVKAAMEHMTVQDVADLCTPREAHAGAGA
jgi:3-hydroxyisobutyrate dehydrogenase-like beta-hydroxyacid dehydrogenase